MKKSIFASSTIKRLYSTKWGNVSLGTVHDGPRPWEKLNIGIVGAPLNLGQVCVLTVSEFFFFLIDAFSLTKA